MPMVLGVNVDLLTPSLGIGAPSTQWWTQIATAIVFGLTFATVLTLIVTPSALMWKANLGASVRRWRGKTEAAVIPDPRPKLKAAE